MIHRFLRPLQLLLFLFLGVASAGAETAREVIARAILADDAASQRELLLTLAGTADPTVGPLLDAWREDALFVFQGLDGAPIPVQLIGEKDASDAQEAVRVATGETLRDAEGRPLRLTSFDLTPVEHTGPLRRVMREVLDLQAIAAAMPATRIQSIRTFGFAQDAEKLPALRARQEVETDPEVLRSLREAIALIGLKSSSADEQVAALRELADLHPLAAADFVQAARRAAASAARPAVVAAADRTLYAIESHRRTVDLVGTLFRGISLGSILLVVALGLAITFGLMGVINMAHGEMIAVGAYTTYLVQNVFGPGVTIPFFGLSLHLPGLNLSGGAYNAYFLVSLPLSFLAAAIVGIGLERSIIQFLYRRPLESLLATWGVSLVLQQVFRLMFGANNVQVSSPSYLSGNWTVSDVILGWNRVFVIGFAVLIVIGIWLVLNRTSLGLLMRAVMQNRRMASCMGVRTERVNMMTFGLGSGLAGLAGAFLSQIGNVGPSLGQGYIVDSFMVVVVGGVGNVAGTVISAAGIGGIDQVLQQYLPSWAPGLAGVPLIGSFLQNLAQDSSVFGKILVLIGIILFLQWKPAGIFVTRSRSLD